MVLALTACSVVWTHPEKNSADFERDLYDCQRDAAPMVDHFLRRNMVHRCLRLKGWQSK